MEIALNANMMKPEINEIDTFRNTFIIIKNYKNWLHQESKRNILSNLPLLNHFMIVYQKEKDKLPYRLNVFDDLRTNENAHSLFLVRLLQNCSSLTHFMEYLNKDDKFFFDTKNIAKPIITAEHMRIDALVRENNKYAIIIENKIHGATEQEQQIGRYIDKCKSIGFKTEQIFILYLTREGDVPTKQTWGKYNPTEFTKRYLVLSYKKDILLWLNNYLTILPEKEHLTSSAVIQYTDHLKHIFNNKEIYTNMDKELQNFLITEIGLKEDKVANVSLVNEKIKEINKINEHLKELSIITKDELFKEWKTKIEGNSELNKYSPFQTIDSNFIKVGIVLTYNDKPFSVLIEHNFNSIYFGIGRHYASDVINLEIKEFIASIIKDEGFKDEPWWYAWKYTSFDNAYIRFEDLCSKIINKLSSIK